MPGIAMYRIKLFATMTLTLAIFIGFTTLAILIIGRLIGIGLYMALAIALIFNLVQWILAPKLIETMYRLRPIDEDEDPKIHEMLENLSRKFGLKKPKIYLADVDAPNAFAFGGIFGEKKVALTRGLLRTLNYDEVEAVVGHELGHISHRDVSIMMGLSMLPTIFYIIWRYSLYSIYFGGYGGRDSRDSGAALWLAIGAASFIFYIILTLILLGFSRVREYYADFAASTKVENGARKLMRALIKISGYHKKASKDLKSYGGFKALLISDPDTKIEVASLHDIDRIIDNIGSRKLSWKDRIMELFSTHPNLVSRIKRLKELEANES